MKRRLYLPFLTLLLLVSAMSCGDETKAPPPGDGTTSPTAFLRTETPVPSPPFTLSQPLDASVVLTEEHLTGAAYFVLYVDSGLMQVLVPDLSEARVGAQGGRAGIFPEWSDNDTLLVRNIDGTTYLARLDGTIAASGHVPQPADLKGAPSTDGKWFASVQVSGQLSVVVSTAPGGAEPRFRITSRVLKKSF